LKKSDWTEQRTAATGQGIMSRFGLHDETLKEMKGPLSHQSSVFDFCHSLPPLLLDVGGNDPYDRPTEEIRLFQLSFVCLIWYFVNFSKV
jgi:hypothetical protein